MFPLASEPKGLARWQVANYRNRGMKSSFSTNISLKESIAGRSKMKKKLGPESKMVSTIFIGRWTARILSSLKERPHRHGELRRHLGSVSQRMLTRTLRNLESTGLISRMFCAYGVGRGCLSTRPGLKLSAWRRFVARRQAVDYRAHVR